MEQFNSLVAQMVKYLPTMQIFDPWVRNIPWRKQWLPTPVFLLGESLGQRSQADYSPWGRKESDRTEQLTLSHSHTHTNTVLTYIYYS